MGKRIDFKEFSKALAITFSVMFIALHVLSLILSTWFPTFQVLVRKFSLAWMVILFSVIVYLVFRMVVGLKSFDKKSIFILLIAITIMLGMSWYFGIDYGQLFDLSVVKSQLPDTLASIIP
jgi:hypothetical protein